MRLIDADALLEALKKERSSNMPFTFEDLIANAPTVQQSEPFGYFKAEPFGWTDCAETDEGAIALYEAPTVQREGWVSVPIEPDKARFIGEFSIDVTHHCSACAFHGAQDDCEVCSGKVEYVQKHTIPWTTFKKMYAEIISAAPTDTE